jgi:hypothetical protein
LPFIPHRASFTGGVWSHAQPRFRASFFVAQKAEILTFVRYKQSCVTIPFRARIFFVVSMAVAGSGIDWLAYNLLKNNKKSEFSQIGIFCGASSSKHNC